MTELVLKNTFLNTQKYLNIDSKNYKVFKFYF